MRPVLLIPITIVAGLGAFVFLPRHHAPVPQHYVPATPGLYSAQAYLLPVTEPSYGAIRDTNVPYPTLDAGSAVLYDMNAGSFLYEHNPEARVPIASLTKLLSALVVQEHFDPGQIIQVASGSVRVDGQKQTLYDNERISAHDLVSMMLVESSNDAAYALANAAKESGIDFVAEMNKKAGALDMRDCRFTDPAGLDDAAYCNANDLVRLVRSALRQAPQIWPIMATKALTITSADGRIVHTVKSTDDLLGQIPGIVGGKTGYTDGALGCLILVVKVPSKGDTLISIILGSRDRFADTKALLNWAQRAYHYQ